jgi:hypothetical protein
VPWTLDNAEARAAEAPRSFFIEPAELRHSLKRGDEVKLSFRLERNQNTLLWTTGYLTDRFPQTADALREGSQRHGILRGRPRDTWWRWDGNRYVRATDS